PFLSLVFFFIRPLPPTSPPFPYTTLFRSPHAVAVDVRLAGVARRRAVVTRIAHAIPVLVGLRRVGRRHAVVVAARRRAAGTRLIDRKSTRLNSSHEWISYAVFCLKKKTTT